MKSFLLSLALTLTFAFASVAQITTPASSPFCKLEQKVGLTDVTVEYSRPSVKDRQIFGDLVQYGQPWRTGANAATKFTFSEDVKVGGKELSAGEYALITVPGKESWELHFFPYSSGSWGSYLSDEEAEAVVVMADVAEMPIKIESFIIDIGTLRNSSAVIYLVWENTVASVALEVPTGPAVEEMIAATMAGPSANDYRAAASYYLQEGKDMDQALEWMNMAIEKGGERYWIMRDKAMIQANLGDYKGAIASAQRSSELAKEAGNNDYVRGNDELIANWSKM